MHPLRCSRRPDPRSSTRSGNRVLLRGLRARVWRPGHGCANSPEASTPGSSSGAQRIAAQQQLDRWEPLVAEQLAMSTSTDDVSARRADHRGPAEDLYDPRGPEDQGRPVGTRRAGVAERDPRRRRGRSVADLRQHSTCWKPGTRQSHSLGCGRGSPPGPHRRRRPADWSRPHAHSRGQRSSARGELGSRALSILGTADQRCYLWAAG